VPSDDPEGGILNFWNVDNANVPLLGPGGTGTALPTRRSAVCTLQAVYGVAATTGAEVPPSPTSGYVPLYLIDLAYGQTQITAPEIVVAGPSVGTNVPSNYPAAPFLAGLLASHHGGVPGQAPQINLASEVQGLLPFSYLPLLSAMPSGQGILPFVNLPSISSYLDYAGNTAGDIPYRASGGWTVLAPAADGTVLQLSGGVPIWGSSAPNANKLTTARTIGISGDLTWSVSFDGSGNVSATGTLATVNSSPGATGDATHVSAVTTNAKGLVTSNTSVAIQSGTVSQLGLVQLVSTSVDTTLADATKALTAAALGTLMPRTANSIVLPGNIKFQFGLKPVTVAGEAFGSDTVTLPSSFATSTYFVSATTDTNAGGNPANSGGNYTAIVYGKSASGFSIRIDNESGASESRTIFVNWIAIGIGP
jgi:hypothetical protein